MKTFSPGEFEEEKEDFELKNNSALINLEITDVTINPSFSSEIKTYNATVVSSLTTVKVTPTAEYSRATIKVNGDTIKSGNQSDNIYLNVGISTINIEVTSYDKKNKSTYNVNITRANVLLSGLTSSSGSLSPAFNPQTFNYSMTVDYFIKTIAFTPFVSDNIVIIEINNLNVANNTQSDPVSLNYGTNQITVKVKYPQDVVATVYYISVTRNPITLFSLSVSSGNFSPSFDPYNYNYAMTVDYFVKNIFLIPSVTDSNVIIDINGNITSSGNQSNPIILNYGSNTIAIKLKYAEDTTETVYNLTVIREQIILSSLLSSAGYFYPSFSNQIFNYNIEVGYNITNIYLTPITTDNTVIIKINNIEVQSGEQSSSINLIYGNNPVLIELKYSEDLIIATSYNINVKRDNEDIVNWNKKIDWHNYSEIANAITTDSLNNVYIAGNGINLVSSTSDCDWWIKKFNSDGIEDTINWNKSYSNDNENKSETIYSIAIDSNNNIYIAGRGYNLVSSSSQYDWWIKKFDSNGIEDTISWNKKIDGGNDYSDTAKCIIIDLNNNVYVAGISYKLVNSTSGQDWWIKKFNSDGIEDTINWNKKINNDNSFDSDDCINSIKIDSKNNLYVAGYGVNLVNSTSQYDWWIKKFNSDGIEDTINWDKKITSNDSLFIEDSAYSITIDSNDNIYIAGCGYNLVSSTSQYDWWIKKFNSDGIEDTINWDKKISHDSYNSRKESAYSITVDSNDNIYVAGMGYDLAELSSGYDWWIKKFDSNGNEDINIWDKKYSNIDSAYYESANAICIDSNNDVYVAGYGINLVNSSSWFDWWIKKFINP